MNILIESFIQYLDLYWVWLVRGLYTSRTCPRKPRKTWPPNSVQSWTWLWIMSNSSSMPRARGSRKRFWTRVRSCRVCATPYRCTHRRPTPSSRRSSAPRPRKISRLWRTRLGRCPFRSTFSPIPGRGNTRSPPKVGMSVVSYKSKWLLIYRALTFKFFKSLELH